jgi:hypothetical protein
MIRVGHTNGFHDISVQYCQHYDSAEKALQLLSAGLYPCTNHSPSSAFTVELLDHYAICATRGTLSAHRYYQILVHLTDNMLPHQTKDRYREMMRITRQWIHLKDLMRAGVYLNSPDDEIGHITLGCECPACPQPGVTFEYSKVEEDEM